MSRLRVVLFASLAGVATAAACTLNPQPLPPSDDNASAGDFDASTKIDAANPENPTPPQDASPANDREAGGDSDAAPPSADGGDAGDAATDADGG